MIKIIKKISKKDFYLLSIAIFSMLISVMCDLLQPLLFGSISKILVQNQINPTWDNRYGIIASLMTGAAFVGVLFNFLAVYLVTKIIVKLSLKLRMEIFNKVQYMSSCDIDKISTSSIITRINHDVFHVEQLMIMLFTLFVKAPIYFIGGLSLSIVTLAYSEIHQLNNISYIYIVFVLLTIFTFLVLSKTFPIFSKVKINHDRNNSVMSENLIGSRVVRAFNLEDNQKERYRERINDLRKNSIKGEVVVQIFMPFFMLVMNLSITFVIGFSSFIAKDHPNKEEIVPLVTSIIQYFNVLLIGFYLVAFVLATYSNTRVSAIRINEIYESKNSIKEIDNPLKIKNNDISFKNVSFKYFEEGEDWAIKNLSFDIKAGETVGVIGQTGSGKSSLVNLITRLYDVNEGKITIGDSDIKDLKISDIRKKISVSLQEKILFSGSIEENIKVGKIDATEEEVKNAAIMAEAYEFIIEKENNFKYKIEERGKNLSGGQKQRVSIARSLISKPEILIFDDSTSALDNITEKKLLTNIKKGLKGSTLIIVAQRINSIKDADKIFVLDKGELIGVGDHKYLMKNNKSYREIYQSQDTSKDK